jgi:hypothetical protein
MKALVYSPVHRFIFSLLLALALSSGPASRAQTLVAHYTFDNAASLGQDSSTNGNNINIFGSISNCGSLTATTNAEAGSHAALFNNGGGSCPNWLVCSNNEVLATIAGSFTMSLWLKTTDTLGSNTDAGFLGEGIVSAFNGGGEVSVPMTLNGSVLGFYTGGIPNDTLHSTHSINTGQYVHLVVTRNQQTGVKQIYLNGVLDSSDTGSTDLLNNPTEMDIGYVSGSGKGIAGQIDDLQIYTNVLSSSSINYLYTHPGSNAITDFNPALDTTNFVWTTGGNTNWFIETTNTYNNPSAAQSGIATGTQSNYLQTTVTGPGNVTFYWQTSPVGNNLDFEFSIDGSDQDDIGNDQTWSQDGPFAIGAGTHTLTWTFFPFGDTSHAEACYLAHVSYVPTVTNPSQFSLISPQIVGTNFQFSFVSQAGFNTIVYYSTNATNASWQTLTNFTGDGTTKTIQFPVSGTHTEFFRVLVQ